jgi:hypothetical protein
LPTIARFSPVPRPRASILGFLVTKALSPRFNRSIEWNVPTEVTLTSVLDVCVHREGRLLLDNRTVNVADSNRCHPDRIIFYNEVTSAFHTFLLSTPCVLSSGPAFFVGLETGGPVLVLADEHRVGTDRH